jgi:hypothetical protein
MKEDEKEEQPSHNPKVVGSNPAPATKENQGVAKMSQPLFLS